MGKVELERERDCAVGEGLGEEEGGDAKAVALKNASLSSPLPPCSASGDEGEMGRVPGELVGVNIGEVARGVVIPVISLVSPGIISAPSGWPASASSSACRARAKASSAAKSGCSKKTGLLPPLFSGSAWRWRGMPPSWLGSSTPLRRIPSLVT